MIAMLCFFNLLLLHGLTSDVGSSIIGPDSDPSLQPKYLERVARMGTGAPGPGPREPGLVWDVSEMRFGLTVNYWVDDPSLAKRIRSITFENPKLGRYPPVGMYNESIGTIVNGWPTKLERLENFQKIYDILKNSSDVLKKEVERLQEESATQARRAFSDRRKSERLQVQSDMYERRAEMNKRRSRSLLENSKIMHWRDGSENRRKSERLQDLSYMYGERAAMNRRRSEMLQKDSEKYGSAAAISQRQSRGLQQESYIKREELEKINRNATYTLKRITSLKNDLYPTQAPKLKLIPWPKGQVALLQPATGCPKPTNESGKWASGHVKFHTESSNYKYPNDNAISQGSHMMKPVLERVLFHNIFNIHTCTRRPRRLHVYKRNAPDWPKGKYCVINPSWIKFNETALIGFKKGYVRLDMETPFATVQSTMFKAPFMKKKKGGDMVIHFLCRDDGNPSSPIELPLEDPFYLFRIDGQCQKVLNADVQEESFTVDTQDDWNKDKMKNAPDVTLNPVKFHTCYYRKADD